MNKDKVKQLQILQKVHGIGDVTGMKYINMGITDLKKLKEAHEDNTITLTHEMLISLKYFPQNHHIQLHPLDYALGHLPQRYL